MTVSDVDNTTLAGATVSISTGFFAGDLLNFTNGSGITGSYNSNTGVLALSGSATLATYQAALRSITFSSSSQNPTDFGTDTSRTISWVANDGTKNSSTVTSTVDITAVNNAPVVTAGATVSYAASGSAATLDFGLTASDVDNTTLAGATVSISSGHFSGNSLNFTDQNGITGNYDGTTGVLTLSGSSSVANYQAALRSITYSSSTQNPTDFGTDTSRTISWQANDGGSSNNLSSTVTSTVDITEVPIVTAGPTVTAVEGVSTGTVTVASFTDPGIASPSVGDFSDTIHWGDGSTSTGTVVSLGGGSFAVSGTHTYAEEGSYAIGVSVTDTSNNTGQSTGSATIGDAALTAGTATVTGGVEGTTAASLSATFSDANSGAPTSDFSGTIDWGDGSALSTFTSANVSGSGGSYTISGIGHIYNEDGNHPVTVVINDAGGKSTTDNGSATVADAPLTAGTATVTAGVEGAPTSVSATFSDANTGAPTSDFSGTINWGDGQTSPFTSSKVTGTGGNFTVTDTHNYAEEGSYGVTVVINDIAGSSTTDPTATTTIPDAPLTAGTATATGGVEGTTAASLSATFSDANTGATASDFSGTIDWGDGSALSTFTGADVTGSAGSYTISGITHTYAEDGNHPLTVVINDDGGKSTTDNGTATIADAPLTAGTATATSGVEGTTAASLSATFSDANTGATASDFSGTIDWGDGSVLSTFTSANVSGSGGSYTISGITHPYAEDGNHPLTVVINDAGGKSTTDNGSATVADAPLTAGTATVTAGVEGAPTSVSATFSDANTGAPTSDFSGTINWGDGQTSPFTSSKVTGTGGNFTVTDTHNYAEEGSYGVTVVINDIAGSSTTDPTATTTIPDAPLTAGTATATGGVEGTTAASLSATFSDANTGATASDFSGTIDWGDGSALSTFTGADVTGSAGSYTISGITHTYAEDGNHPLTVVINDDGGKSTTDNGTATIADAPLTAGTATATSGVEGTTAASLSATFSDANTGATASDFSGTIDWGDGSVLSTFTSANVSGSGGSYTISGITHPYAEDGNHPLTVVINDAGGKSTTDNGTATVADAPLTAGAATATGGVEGTTAAALSATFTDANTGATASDFSGTIDWGDGSILSTFTSANVSGSGGSYTISGITHPYAEDGNHPLTVVINDAGGKSTTDNGTATVADAPLTAGAATATGGVEGTTAAALSATFTDANTGATASDFSGTIDWGDGSILSTFTSANVSGSGGSYTISGITHPYAEDGNHPLTVVINDDGGKSTTDNGTATVADAPLTAGTATATGGVEGTTAAALSATFSDANTGATASDFSGTIDWGDGSVLSTFTSANVSGSGGSYTISGITHPYAEDGNHPLTVVINDDGGKSTTDNGTATVADAPLTAGAATATGGVEGTTAAALSATFSDANTGATASDFSGTIDWGDGQTSTFTSADVTGSAGSYTISGITHPYAEDGNHPLTVVINDDGGKSTTDNGTATVADAPLTAGTATATGGVEGTTAAALSATFSDANTGATASDFSGTIDWGDGSVLSTFTSANVSGSGGSYTISGIGHTYNEDGNHPLTVVISDDGGKSTTDNGTATVADAPLTAGTTTATGGIAGNVATSLSAAFTDANTGAPTSDFSGTINWGDGTISAFTSAIVTGSAGNFTIAGSHLYAQNGTYTVSLAIRDTGGSTTTDSGSTIVYQRPAITSVVGQPANDGTVELDGTGSKVGDTVNLYADGNTTNIVGTGTVDTSGNFDITTNATFVDGTHSFTAVESGIPVSSLPFSVGVQSIAPSGLAQKGTTIHGGTLEITGTGDTAGDTIDLYNGTTLVGSGKAGTNGAFDIVTTATFPYGNYNITAKDVSADGTQVSAASSPLAAVVIPPAPSTPVDSDASANTIAEKAATGTTVGLTASSSDLSGVTLTYSLSADSSGGGFKIDPSTGVVSVADGSKLDYGTAPGHAYNITVLVNDGTLTSSQNFTIAVSNVPPFATSETLTLPNARAGAPYTFQLPTGLFGDVSNVPLTLSVQNLPPGLKFDASTGIISGVPSSLGQGNDTFTLTATDPFNATAQRSVTLFVNSPLTIPNTTNNNTSQNTGGTGNTGNGGTGTGGNGTGGNGNGGNGNGGNGNGGPGSNPGGNINFTDSNTYTVQSGGLYIHFDTTSTGGGGEFVLAGQVPHDGTFRTDPQGLRSFTLPDGTFDSNDPGLTVDALSADGDPLPAWLHFDPRTGTFTIVGHVPARIHHIIVQVIGRTKDGHRAVVKFTLTITDQHAELAPLTGTHFAAADVPVHAGSHAVLDAPAGKLPVSHWIKAASADARLSHRDALIADLALLFGAGRAAKDTGAPAKSEIRRRTTIA